MNRIINIRMSDFENVDWESDFVIIENHCPYEIIEHYEQSEKLVIARYFSETLSENIGPPEMQKFLSEPEIQKILSDIKLEKTFSGLSDKTVFETQKDNQPDKNSITWKKFSKLPKFKKLIFK